MMYEWWWEECCWSSGHCLLVLLSMMMLMMLLVGMDSNLANDFLHHVDSSSALLLRDAIVSKTSSSHYCPWHYLMLLFQRCEERRVCVKHILSYDESEVKRLFRNGEAERARLPKASSVKKTQRSVVRCRLSRLYWKRNESHFHSGRVHVNNFFLWACHPTRLHGDASEKRTGTALLESLWYAIVY